MPLAADADLTARNIENQGSGTSLTLTMFFLVILTFMVLLSFGQFPRAKNHIFHFNFIYNEGVVETVSLCTRFMSVSDLCALTYLQARRATSCSSSAWRRQGLAL